MKYILFLIAIVSLISCGTDKKGSKEENKKEKFKVGYNGALKNMMHQGDISAKIDLKDFENLEHFYALGAFENLKGEIQIFDSKPYNTMVTDSTLNMDSSFNKKATLLVYANVSKWKSISIPETVLTYEQLESYIEQTAKENNIAIEEPFPFLLEGRLQSFNWHIINWKDGDTDHSHQKHISSGLHGTMENEEVELLGFYSNSHHAIFTHHASNMHIHFKTVDKKIAGHLDDLSLGKGMILKLPDNN